MNQSLAITPVQNMDFALLLPEIILSLTGVVVMLIDAFVRRRAQRWLTGGVSLAGIVTAGVATISLWDSARAAAEPIVRRVAFDGEDWLYFKAIRPDVAIIRATTADERGNLGERNHLRPDVDALAG